MDNQQEQKPQTPPEKHRVRKPRKRWLTLNKIYWFVILAIVLAGTFMLVDIGRKYVQSSTWKEAPDSKIALANQSIDMLYDKSEKSRQSKIEFSALYNKIMKKDGDLNSKQATPENIDKIKELYKNMSTHKGSETNYQKMYAEVLLKYSIQQQFDNLFTDTSKTVFERTVTPKTIVDLNESTFADLTALFVQNPDDAFVHRIIELETSMNKDIQTLDGMAKDFNDAFVFTGKTVTLRPGYHDDIVSKHKRSLSNLDYNWESTTYMSKIVDVMEPVINWTVSKYAKFADYQADMKAKATALAGWEQEKQQFLAQVKATHEAAVKAKHQAEYDEGFKAGKQDALDKKDKADLKDKKQYYIQGYNAGYQAGLDEIKKAEDTEKANGRNAGLNDGRNGRERANLDGKSTLYVDGYNEGYNAGHKEYLDKKDYEAGQKDGDADARANKPKADLTTKSTKYAEGYNKAYDAFKASQVQQASSSSSAS